MRRVSLCFLFQGESEKGSELRLAFFLLLELSGGYDLRQDIQVATIELMLISVAQPALPQKQDSFLEHVFHRSCSKQANGDYLFLRRLK